MPRLVVIPTGDAAFAAIAERFLDGREMENAGLLQARLRQVFPRAVVRPRDLGGEAPVWYVYRDGSWSSDAGAQWWQAPDLPRLEVTRDGWLADANLTALGLLEVEPADMGNRHFTDFVVPGTLTDAQAIFGVVDEGRDLTATVLLRPSSGHVLPVDIHASREGDRIVSVFRMAKDVQIPELPDSPQPRLTVECRPKSDAAFREYVDRALSRMPEPTPEGLAMRLRRLYPRAEVVVTESRWLANRDPDAREDDDTQWWTGPSLPVVRYDAQALILEANAEARALLGRELVGRYWQELVIPGSDEEVSDMMAILAELGRAESRFRMPRADGSLVEFDSYTEVDGETFVTVMRERA